MGNIAAFRFKLRRDSSTNWTSVNPILADGEPGVEEDTLKWKVGDGISHWVDLSYMSGGGGGGGGGATNLTVTRTTTAVVVASDTGTDATIAAVDSNAGVMTGAMKSKFDTIATGATANSTDAALRDRTSHTGQQASTTISDFTEAVQDAVAALLSAGTNVSLTYNDTSNTLTVAASGAGGGLDAEAVRDAIGVAMIGTAPISVTVNDAADTISISTTATINSTDAALRDRSTHTGSQTASTISDLAEAVQDLVGAALTESTGIDVTYNDGSGTITIAALTASTTQAGIMPIATTAEVLAGVVTNKAVVPTGVAAAVDLRASASADAEGRFRGILEAHPTTDLQTNDYWILVDP